MLQVETMTSTTTQLESPLMYYVITLYFLSILPVLAHKKENNECVFILVTLSNKPGNGNLVAVNKAEPHDVVIVLMKLLTLVELVYRSLGLPLCHCGL